MENLKQVIGVSKAIVEVHISTIVIGDSVICPDGIERTVGKGDIKLGSFMGTTLFGDSYRSGYKPVRKVLYERLYER